MRKINLLKIAGGIAGGIILLLALAFGVFAIIGGGLGQKQSLPTALIGGSEPIIFAHRAAPNQYPENTWAGMLLAKEKGFPGLEVDVQLTADSIFVAFHDRQIDSWLKRPGEVAGMTLEEVQSTPIFYHGKPTRQYVVTMDSVAEEFKDDFVIFFDMKRTHHQSSFELADMIDTFLGNHSMHETTIVANGYLPFITLMEYRYPRIVTCLQGFRPAFSPLFDLLPRRFQPDFIACDMNWITPEFLTWLKANQMIDRFIAYGVKKNTYADFQAMGLRHFIVTYRPFMDDILNGAAKPGGSQ